MLLPKHLVVGGGGHQEEHGEGEVEVGPRAQEAQAGEGGGIGRDGGAVGGEGLIPSDELFIHPPDDAPDVEQHHPAHTPAESDGELAGAFPAVGIERKKGVTAYGDDDQGDDSKNVSVVDFEYAHGEIEERPDESPNDEERDLTQHDGGVGEVAKAGVVGISGGDVAPVEEADEDSAEGSPAEEKEGAQHERRDDFGPGGAVEFLEERDVDEVEEVKQADPSDAEDKVQKAQDDLVVGVEVAGEREGGREHWSLLEGTDDCNAKSPRPRVVWIGPG